MADNYLITGYWGEPHVTAENDRGINAAMFGAGRFVLPVGEQFRAEYIGNNTIRMYDGKLMDNGAAAGIPVGEYVDLLIANAGQGKKRNDLIVFQYSQDHSTLVESGIFTVIQGSETDGTASDPTLTQEDLLSGEAAFDQMAMWRVSVSGATISAPEKLFTVHPGAAPAGFGLGQPNLDACDGNDANNAIRNGKYNVYTNTAHSPGVNGAMEVTCRTYGAAHQLVTEDSTGCMFYRHQVSGEWQPWEWVNPRLVDGVEYRTTERWNGKPVYTATFNIGALPNASTKTAAVQGKWATSVIRYDLVVNNGSNFRNYQHVSGLSEVLVRADGTQSIYMKITTTSNLSAQTATAQVWYTY